MARITLRKFPNHSFFTKEIIPPTAQTQEENVWKFSFLSRLEGLIMSHQGGINRVADINALMGGLPVGSETHHLHVAWLNWALSPDNMELLDALRARAEEIM